MNQLRLARQLLGTPRLSLLRASLSASSLQKDPSLPAEKYKDTFNCVYKFKYINHLRLFSRIKIYQTAGSALLALGSALAYDAQLLDLNSLLLINGAMVFALAMLLVISRQCVKVVGRIYVSDDGQRVLLSHLNFMGKRRDVELERGMVEPLSSLDELNESVLKLRLKGMDGCMYVPLKHGEVYDKDTFLAVFNVVLKKKKVD